MAGAASLPTLAELEAAAAARRSQFTDERRLLPPALVAYREHLSMLVSASRDWDREQRLAGLTPAVAPQYPEVVFPSSPASAIRMAAS